MKTHLASIAVALSACLLSLASPVRADKVDDYVQAQLRKQGIPGLSIAVVRGGEVVKAKGYGLSNVELNVAASPETIYQSGSVGKQFTATLVMMLIQEGKLGLDDPVSKYIAEAPAAWKGITVRHLLTHTSGISNGLYAKINLHQDFTEDELLKQITAYPLDFQPGEKWNYSNSGYVTLGILIHRAMGKFYGDLLREKIFAPLGMSTARIISEADIVPNRAAGYRIVGDELKNQDWVSPSLSTTADGALYLTVLDMAKWDAALDSEKLLPRSALDQMWTPAKLNDGKTEAYGFGWEIGSIRGHRVIRHGGGWQGFTTHIARYVDDKLAVIVLTNLSGANPGRICDGIAGLYETALAPEEPKILRIDPSRFDACLGVYDPGNGFTFTLLREGDKLWVQTASGRRLKLDAESESKLYIDALDTELTCVKDSSGKVTHLNVNQQGHDTEAKKVK